MYMIMFLLWSAIVGGGEKNVWAIVGGPSCARPRADAPRSGFERHPPPPPEGLRSGAILRQPSSRQPASERSPTDPALRANPFSEVTDPFCRLPFGKILGDFSYRVKFQQV